MKSRGEQIESRKIRGTESGQKRRVLIGELARPIKRAGALKEQTRLFSRAFLEEWRSRLKVFDTGVGRIFFLLLSLLYFCEEKKSPVHVYRLAEYEFSFVSSR